MAEEQKNQNAPVVEEPKRSNVPLMVAAAIVIVLGGLIGGIAYLAVNSSRVKIDKADIEAPSVVLSPTAAGTLMAVYVNPGDTIAPNAVVAEVGTELIHAGPTGGLVISTDNNIGAQVAPGTAVVTLVDPTQLRVVGHLDENKGLAKLAVGDRAVFTVDAFGGQSFEGVVSEISPTSNASDVVFSVSDQRQEQNFDVKVSYDVAKYPQLKNGMSARIWAYVN
jgi:multidrug resistance efflux pump